MCGMAASLSQLIFFRVLQGISGGGLQPSEQAILVDTFPPQKRGMAMAVFTMAILVAPILGPTLGGWITDNYGWRWIFYINVPVGCLSLFLSNIVVQDPPHLKERTAQMRSKGFRIDYIGIGLLALGLAALEVVLDKGQEEDWFDSWLIVGFAATAVVALVTAVVWELRHPQPIVNLRLFKDRNFLVCCLIVFCTYGVLYGSTVLLPQMMQSLMGYSATTAGLVLSPAGLVTLIELPFVGLLLGWRVDARWMIVTGLAVIAFASWWMSHAEPASDADGRDRAALRAGVGGRPDVRADQRLGVHERAEGAEQQRLGPVQPDPQRVGGDGRGRGDDLAGAANAVSPDAADRARQPAQPDGDGHDPQLRSRAGAAGRPGGGLPGGAAAGGGAGVHGHVLAVRAGRRWR